MVVATALMTTMEIIMENFGVMEIVCGRMASVRKNQVNPTFQAYIKIVKQSLPYINPTFDGIKMGQK